MNLNCKTLNTFVYGVLMALLSGCLSRPVQVAASSDPIEPGKFSTLGIEVSGTDTQVMFFGMTFGSSGSGLRRAIDEALGEAPGADKDRQIIRLSPNETLDASALPKPEKALPLPFPGL